MWEVVAILSFPLPSFSEWWKEARPQACLLLGPQGGLQRLTSA